MANNNLFIHPYIRLMFLVGSVTGVLLINKIEFLLLYYLLVIIPLFLYSNQIKKHLNLLLFAFVPIYLSFILLYILILKEESWQFINLKVLKLVLFTSTIQLVLTIPTNGLISTFKKFGLKGDALVTVLGAFTVWTDVSNRSEKIITARFARGFIGKRTFFNKAKQFPFVLVPLVVGILRTSTERADSWEQKNILQLVENHSVGKTNYPTLLNSIVITVTICWVILSIYVYV